MSSTSLPCPLLWPCIACLAWTRQWVLNGEYSLSNRVTAKVSWRNEASLRMGQPWYDGWDGQ